MNDLSKILMITGLYQDKNTFLEKVTLHFDKGIKFIQLRVKALSKKDYTSLAKDVIDIGKRYEAKIVLNTEVKIAKGLDADGIHLSSGLLMNSRHRPLSTQKIVSAACHNIEQLRHAKQIGVDFVTLSPVLPTKTHPDANPIGWINFSKLCKAIQMPIYALGGLSETDLNIAMANGAHGIAAISSLWDKL